MPAPTREPKSLPVLCPTCGQPVTLSYTPAKTLQREHWQCPHVECKTIHPIEIRGFALVAAITMLLA